MTCDRSYILFEPVESIKSYCKMAHRNERIDTLYTMSINYISFNNSAYKQRKKKLIELPLTISRVMNIVFTFTIRAPAVGIARYNENIESK